MHAIPSRRRGGHGNGGGIFNKNQSSYGHGPQKSGQSGGNPYHGAANAYENDDNDSITTLHNNLAKLTHSSNTNTNELETFISSMEQEMTALHITVGQHAQQLANIATTPMVDNPAWSAPPTWAAPPPVPTNKYLNPGATNL